MALRSFLLQMSEGWGAWMAALDIALGTIWRQDLARTLRSADCGVVCVSAETRRSPWVLFETGVLSASGSTVCPYLIGLVPRNLVHHPLFDFQGCEATEEGTRRLVESLNDHAPEPRAGSEIDRAFDRAWPELEAAIRDAPSGQPVDPEPAVELNLLDDVGLEKLLMVHFYAAADRILIRPSITSDSRRIGARERTSPAKRDPGGTTERLAQRGSSSAMARARSTRSIASFPSVPQSVSSCDFQSV
jgi:hypothetical protein